MALNNEVNNKFRIAFEEKCYSLIIMAYQTSLIEGIIQLDWNENDISSELHRCMKENPSRIKWKISTNVEANIPSNILKKKGFADKYLRIDFRLTTFSTSYEYEYFFEAKNLKQNNSALKRRYIDTGINNFISQKYTNGSLIGYLIEGKTDDTVKGINSFLKKDNRSDEILIKIPTNFFNTYYESDHLNIGKMKHLIFDFTSLSN